MSKPANVIPIEDAVPQTRKSPAAELIDNAGPGYLTMKKMAERYDVHIETMRRLCKLYKDGEKVLKAPTSAIQQGKLLIYLFNEKDVAEVDAYMTKRGHVIAKDSW